ncbi:MAG: 4-alpha-glucanotransferase [Thermodesulfobacteriota bacterium]
MRLERGSGILLHITSLPGRYGTGDLGRGAYAFVDFLAAAGQKYWQFLPLCPTSQGLDNSPYMGLSAFAGNPLMLSPEQLVADGLLPQRHLDRVPDFSEYLVDFARVIPWKRELFEAAFQVFQYEGGAEGFDDFCSAAPWLDDYALFMALREEQRWQPWYQWSQPLAGREEGALAASRKRLSGRTRYHKFLQYCFSRQWRRLHEYATAHGVRLIGDIPIYVAPDSADVWARQECFTLQAKGFRPTHVAGVPPDYFSKTGQRWGNPLFRWHSRDPEVREHLYAWWRERFRQVFALADIVRIDHFRGFESYWEIPASEPDAVKGRWVKGPGHRFFTEMEGAIGRLPIIAEDLGVITPAVEELREAFSFPGMKVLQFAFDSDEKNAYLPHNFPSTNCVVYTGTHDNDTTVGWYFSDRVESRSKERALRYAHSQVGSPIHWDFIRLAFSSVAAVALIPLQDLLGFGSDCRMNTPGTPTGNWRWRVAPRFLTDELGQRLRDETHYYNRLR